MLPTIIFSQKNSWSKFAASEILGAINKVLLNKSFCYLMLTGGNTAKKLYNELAIIKDFPFERIIFLIGDERCVSMEDENSNYSMIKNSLFKGKIDNSILIKRVIGESNDPRIEAKKYADSLPEYIDILLLGLGLDGHIASLFPFHDALKYYDNKVFVVNYPGIKHTRITVGPKVIIESKNIFLLATGRDKGRVLLKALSLGSDYVSLPVCLTKSGTWLLDDEAYHEIKTLV